MSPLPSQRRFAKLPSPFRYGALRETSGHRPALRPRWRGGRFAGEAPLSGL